MAGKRIMRAAVAAVGAVLLGVTGMGTAWAQDAYPMRSIRIVVPFAAGGVTDVLGRAVAQKLGEQLQQTIVVENVAGASTMIGAERVARSAPDGYTLLIASSTTFSVNPHLYKSKMTYSLDDFEGVTLIAKNPLVFSVSLSAPFKTVPEMIDYAKKNPGKVMYGTQGRGGIAHLIGEMAANVMDVKMTDVPYKGSAPALTDLMGGQIPIHVDSTITSLPLYQAGKIGILAITSDTRAEAAPDIPTFTELGYPDMAISTLYALFAPKGTPSEVIERLNSAMKHVLESEDFRAKLRPQATTAEWTTPAQQIDAFSSDYERFGKIIEAMGIEMQ